MVSMIEFWQIGRPSVPASPYDMVVTNGGLFDAKLNWTTGDYTNGFGSSAVVLPVSQGGLQIENYKQIWTVMASALAQSPVNLTLIRHAVKGCEFALSFRNNKTVNGILYTGPTGSFPAQHNGDHSKSDRFHNKSMGMHAVIRTLQMAKASPFYTGADATWIDSLIVQLAEYVAWMTAPNSNLADFFSGGQPTNQWMTVCCFLQAAGKLYADSTITALSYTYFQKLFDNGVQQVDTPLSTKGVFYEKQIKDGVGFDGSYMGFSLQNLGEAVIEEPPGPQRDLMLAQLEMGVRRWLQTVRLSDGTISATNLFLPTGNVPYVWTRVKETFPPIPGLDSKGWNYDAFSYRYELMNYIFGNSIVPDDLANKVTLWGRSFGHIKGDPVTGELFIVLSQTEINTVKGPSAVVDWAALTQVPRVGGGNCPSYSGGSPPGTLPNPCFILPISVLDQPVFAASKSFLVTLPVVDILAPGFPAAT
jgi:hypothetical protein